MTTSALIPVLNVTALVTLMLSMGMQVNLAEVVISARPARRLARGLIANFVIVPGITIGLLHVVQADPMVSVGFFILAVCPGAPIGPLLTGIARGAIPWAVGMMLVLAVLSAVVSPALLGAFLAGLGPGRAIPIPYVAIVQVLLITQLLPLAVGLGIHRGAPGLTARIGRPLGLVANVILLVLIVLILATQYETLAAIRLRGWLGMGVLLVSSLGIGWLCGGPGVRTRKVMALTTATRSVAVALVIAQGHFAGTPAVTAVVAYGLVSTLGALSFAVWLGRFAAREPRTPPALA